MRLFAALQGEVRQRRCGRGIYLLLSSVLLSSWWTIVVYAHLDRLSTSFTLTAGGLIPISTVSRPPTHWSSTCPPSCKATQCHGLIKQDPKSCALYNHVAASLARHRKACVMFRCLLTPPRSLTHRSEREKLHIEVGSIETERCFTKVRGQHCSPVQKGSVSKGQCTISLD